MALFGLFGKKDEVSQTRKLGERATNKRAQAVDRWEAIQALAGQDTSEAVEALLPRFSFRVDPSITDEEEKELAFNGIVATGEPAHAPVKAYLRRSDSIGWPLKMLDRLLSPEQVISELLALLSEMDTEYERDPSRKIDIISVLEERQDPRIVETVSRFVEDTNETVRFTAVGAIYAQEGPEAARESLLQCLCSDESVRVRNRILDGFIRLGWDAAERVDEVKKQLPAGYAIDRAGKLTKR